MQSGKTVKYFHDKIFVIFQTHNIAHKYFSKFLYTYCVIHDIKEKFNVTLFIKIDTTF